VRPGIAERVSPLLGPPPPASFEGLATTLINELAAEEGSALLVLDDYHLIEAQAVSTSLQFLVAHRPPGLHVVLASRADPQLPLARLRARGQLAELRAAELVFTVDEAAALLREAFGSELREDTVAALVACTEGWAAGLQLGGLSLRGQPNVAGFVAMFSGSHRHVLDYLTEEVLEQQPLSVREFLFKTSVLDRLSGPLCDAVTGRADGHTCWRPSREPTCSWRLWTRYEAGGATTACSPTSSAPACNSNNPSRHCRCTAAPPPGTRSTGWLTTPCATHWPLRIPSGRPG
jgi:LuxR family maltose regulon positive regulatory protein